MSKTDKIKIFNGERIEDINLSINIKLAYKAGEDIQEIKSRFIKALQWDIKRMGGLLTTSWWNPFSKSYYFSVRKVKIK